jgi:DnaJ-class molecular chaperone
VIRDPYAVLGLAPGANITAVKLAYRRLVKGCHPDVAPDDPTAAERFHEIRRAYDVLNRRLQRNALTPRTQNPYQPREDDRARVRVKAPSRGADRCTRLDLTLEEMALGTERRLDLAPGIAVIAKIPPGAEPGAMLRFAGLGLPGGNGGPPGDGLVTLGAKPHARFRLDGADVHLRLEISQRRLAAGGFLRAPTLTGDVQIRVPKGLEPGATLRLRGRGLPGRGKRPAGDFFVTLIAPASLWESATAA